ncbi:MAG: hypothetical protein K6G34_09355 [Lachnospiraceae bacterium]|nr:hypothetical protein [Lachnospiraceae bacterium]
MKAIETEYKGYKFRSRLEARWAVFFDACGVRWEYEPEGYALPDGQFYLPDFLLHDVTFNHAGYSEGNDLYVEVKGKMTAEDANKIRQFAFPPEANGGSVWIPENMNPLLVVSNIPDGGNNEQIEMAVFYNDCFRPNHFGIEAFNFETVDGDNFGAMPGVGFDGKFQLFGADSSYTGDMDPVKTERAYRLARQARFEHGECPKIRR